LKKKTKNYIIHSESAIDGIRIAAQAAATVKNQLAGMVRPGMSTKEIDNLASALISSTGGRSAFLGYRGFPGQICISVNDEVVHGIGSTTKIVNRGDLLSLDIGVNIDGYIGDNAISVIVGGGELTSDIERLMTGTKAALEAGINAALPGNKIRDISRAVEKTAKQFNLTIVQEYVGHGCGVKLHEPPEIPNYTTRTPGPTLRPGMVLAIEPMLNLGKRNVITDKDGWTVRTKDGRLSAHFEHMVLVTQQYPEILTWQKT
jgi:methionyl aminopeptidase